MKGKWNTPGAYSLRPDGYLRQTIDGVRKLRHQWVWLVMRGPIPAGYHVHHINGDRADNRIENLELLPFKEHRRRHAPSFKKVRGEWVKTCATCKKTKPETAYYLSPKISNECKVCFCRRSTANKRKRRGANE